MATAPPRQFTIRQTNDDVTIDTGDGSLFGVPEPASETPLHYRLDGSVVTVVDRSLGDIPSFTRKINTEALWDSNWRLLTFTTHFSENAKRHQRWKYASAHFFHDCRRSTNESRKDGIQGQASR